MAEQDIILGDGAFFIGTTPVALTLGGGKFTVEYEYRHIAADGDYGIVKGRTRVTRATPKLNMKALEILTTSIPKMYPGKSIDTTTDPTKAVITDTLTISSSDYNEVKWVGATQDGRDVEIVVKNAINMENFDWALVDKNEIVAELTFTGTYDPANRKSVPYTVTFAV